MIRWFDGTEPSARGANAPRKGNTMNETHFEVFHSHADARVTRHFQNSMLEIDKMKGSPRPASVPIPTAVADAHQIACKALFAELDAAIKTERALELIVLTSCGLSVKEADQLRYACNVLSDDVRAEAERLVRAGTIPSSFVQKVHKSANAEINEMVNCLLESEKSKMTTAPNTTTDHTTSDVEKAFWAQPDDLRDEARELIRSGAVTESTSLGEAWRAQDERNKVAQQ